MKNDITKLRRIRVGRPSLGRQKTTSIDFYVYEVAALNRYKSKTGRGSRALLIDGLQLLPGFSVILKQEKHRYDRQQEKTGVHKDAKRIEADFSPKRRIQG